MKKNITFALVIWVGLALVVNGCAAMAGSYRNYIKVKGKIQDGRYTSPAENFSCKIPALGKPGAVIRDTSGKENDKRLGTVWFEDDFGTLNRVDWLEIKGASAQLSDKELLQRFLNFQMANYGAAVRGTTLETNYFTGTGTNLTLFFSAHLPEGATLSENGRRLDACRSSLIFRRTDWIYCVTTQRIEKLSKAQNTIEERNRAMRSDLEEFLAGFEFK